MLRNLSLSAVRAGVFRAAALELGYITGATIHVSGGLLIRG